MNSKFETTPTFIPENWHYLGQWHQPTLSNCLWCYWHITQSVKTIFPDYNFHSIIDPDCQFWIAKKDLESFRNISSSFNEDSARAFITNLNKVSEDVAAKHLELLEQLDEHYTSYIPKLFETSKELMGIWSIVVWFGDEHAKYIMAKMGYSEEDLLSMVSQHTRPTWLQEEYQSIKSISKKVSELHPAINADEITADFINKNSAIKALVDKHVETYDWYGTHHWMGEKYTFEKCLDEVKQYIKTQGEKKLDERTSDQKWHFLTDVLPEFAYWRTHCAEVAAKVVFKSRGKLEECARDLSLTYDDLIFLSDQEIIESVQQKKLVVSKEEIEERKKAQGCYVEGTTLKVLSGNELQTMIKSLKGEDNKEKAEIKSFRGSIACKAGIVKGRVAVLISPKDFQNFKPGDILVAPETTPDFVPYMQSAVAVVTDTGGITSHAAIVSREMHIPCVIGTKVATQVLKTGMMVEVNSETGIITIIE